MLDSGKGDIMKSSKILMLTAALVCVLTACTVETTPKADIVQIDLSDESITVNGNVAETDPEAAVYVGSDIIYYEAGKDFTYGEGSEEDAHSPELAAAHKVVHITQPGTYSLSGTLSRGQIAVDLGEDAKEDPTAVVTLILNGADITCEVAPAVIFYHVYECGDTENPTKDVDTSMAGANVIIADGTANTIHGAYVARIYKPDSVVLNDTGTEVEDAKKLHKYDGAFYSRMSMNVDGQEEGTGILTIYAENEGLDSELHLTINGGIIHINSGNDGINTNEDGVSVTTVNGGTLNIKVTGETGEGDGIDSNGWLVINGGTVTARACSFSGDAGIDSDMGIHINGGTVLATGHMLDRIEDGGQNYAVFTFAQKQSGADIVSLKKDTGEEVVKFCPENDYSILVYSSPDLAEGTYSLWSNDVKLVGQKGGMMGRPGMPAMPEGMEPPEPPEGMELPEGMERPEPPEDFEPFEGQEPPEGFGHGRRPGGENEMLPQELAPEFPVSDGGNMFENIGKAE